MRSAKVPTPQKKIGHAPGLAQMGQHQRSHRFLRLRSRLQEAAGRNRHRHLAEMDERLFRLDNDFALMRKARKILLITNAVKARRCSSLSLPQPLAARSSPDSVSVAASLNGPEPGASKRPLRAGHPDAR